MKIADILVSTFIILIAIILGKICMLYYGDSWMAFNGPVLAILLIGFGVYFTIRDYIKRKDRK